MSVFRRKYSRTCLSQWIYISIFALAFSLSLVFWFASRLHGVIVTQDYPALIPMQKSAPDLPIKDQQNHKKARKNKDGKSNADVERNNVIRKIESKNGDGSEEIKGDTLIYGFNRKAMEDYLTKNGATKLRKIIGAFLEPETSFAIPETINQGANDKDDDPGIPPKFITPLPLRTYTPDDLKHYEYPKFQTCHDLPAKLPVDRGLELDKNGQPIVWNIGDTETPPNYPWDEAPFCPVDADPFLPWIHDVFPSVDGAVLEFIAHNRRRCKTGRKNRKDVLRLEPQVALLQHVSVQRITQSQAVELAPELWNDDSASLLSDIPRYRLAPMNESSPDGRFTRFLCRFHGTTIQANGEPQTVIINETLSIYPFNYEFVSYRKGKPTMISPKGKDNKFFWTSVLRFQCPIPSNLQKIVTRGYSILSDGTPTLHVDLIPIRTPPRFGVDEMYLTEEMIGPQKDGGDREWNSWKRSTNKTQRGFDPYLNWGEKSVLPRVEASGRWTNLPICQVPSLPEDSQTQDRAQLPLTGHKKRGVSKPHLLSACVWASASFKTRGKGKSPIVDTGSRLKEWIEFHLMVGFDHIYIFDNSAAHTNDVSLKPILDEFPKSQVTRIEWPSIICNNNVPAHDSTGERSSQYTAENSCRTRFSSYTEWIAAFDTDEYLIPQGNFTSLRDVLKEASSKKETNILTFRSSRARLLHEKSIDTVDKYRVKLPNITFMEAYNCDSSPIPKAEWAERARKQIYRADYVPFHFVHYSTVTKGLMTEYKDKKKKPWRRVYDELTERVTDEANEAIMLHAKTTTKEQTSNWQDRCHYQFKKKWRGCYLGFPWPEGKEDLVNNHRAKDGLEYNCFRNQRIDLYWLPRLKTALDNRTSLSQ